MSISSRSQDMRDEGYRQEAPSRSAAQIDGEAARLEVCKCGRTMRYVPWSKRGSYVAWAVCDSCDRIVEF